MGLIVWADMPNGPYRAYKSNGANKAYNSNWAN